MPRVCKLCEHESRQEIERKLLSGMSNRKIASVYGVSEAAVRRHRSSHLLQKLTKAKDAREVTEADSLLAEVRDLLDKSRKLLDKAEKNGDVRTALAGVKEARSTLELLGKLQGRLDERPQIHLHLSSEWVELRALIVVALEPYSEAKEAVLRALEGAGNGRA